MLAMFLNIGDVLGFIVLLLLSLLSYKGSMTSLSGTLAGIILGATIILFGGWQWFVVFIAFFLIGSLATKFRLAEKVVKGVAQEKGGMRGWKNAVSNGLPAAIGAISYPIYNPAAIFFASSLSSALADTLATEIGVLSLREPRLITNPSKRVPVGMSGGFTPEGYAAALLGSLVISSMSSSLGVVNFGIKGFLSVMLAGLLGSTVDSFIGSTIQAKYHCPACNRIVEVPTHCGQHAEFLEGVRWVDNHMTNLLSNSIAGLAGLLIYYAL